MNLFKIDVSETYKKAQKSSIFWIILFFITLLSFSLLSIGLFILCILGGIFIISIKVSIITIILGLGIFTLGSLVLYYSIKFILSIFQKIEYNGIEIFEKDNPELFQLITKTANEVGVDTPKKVFILGGIGAYVSYSNNLKSLIFPTRKNLSIGIGLLYGVTENELKAVLAHEFGHFSQKSMIVGSYVGNISKIVENVLYSNKSLKEDVDNIEDINQLVGIISLGAVAYNKLIESVLKIIHKQLEFNYLKLSREMEYHADKIATNVVGMQIMSKPLLRIELYEYAYNELIPFFMQLQDKRKYSENIYENMLQLVDFYVEHFDLDTVNNLPNVEFNKFNQNYSLIQLEDLWSTHPELDKRLKNIESTQIDSIIDTSSIAINLLNNREQFEKSFSVDFFFNLGLYRVNEIDKIEFFETFYNKFSKSNYPKIYNGLFNDYAFDFNSIIKFDTTNYTSTKTKENLFSDENILITQQLSALQLDTVKLEFLSQQKKMQQFIYNDKVYNKKEDLLKIQTELGVLLKSKEEEVQNYINEVFYFFKTNIDTDKNNLLNKLIQVQDKFSPYLIFLDEIRNDLSFTTRAVHERIRIEGLTKLNEHVNKLKVIIREILDLGLEDECFSHNQIDSANYFLEEDLIFFYETGYNNSAFETLFENIFFVEKLSNLIIFQAKYDYLDAYNSLLIETKKEIA